MRKNPISDLLWFYTFLLLIGCNEIHTVKPSEAITNAQGQQVYQDTPYLQDYSIKYYITSSHDPIRFSSISLNRDG